MSLFSGRFYLSFIDSNITACSGFPTLVVGPDGGVLFPGVPPAQDRRAGRRRVPVARVVLRRPHSPAALRGALPALRQISPADPPRQRAGGRLPRLGDTAFVPGTVRRRAEGGIDRPRGEEEEGGRGSGTVADGGVHAGRGGDERRRRREGGGGGGRAALPVREGRLGVPPVGIGGGIGSGPREEEGQAVLGRAGHAGRGAGPDRRAARPARRVVRGRLLPRRGESLRFLRVSRATCSNSIL